MKILVADDDSVSRLVLSRNLAKWGYEVTTVENGAEAWRLFQEEHHEMVISDWIMPEMDGPTLLRKIRGSQGDSYTYVVMLTSKTETNDLIEGMEAGADDFLTKPFYPEELRVRLRAGGRLVELERQLAERNRLLSQSNQELATANERMRRDLEAAARVQQAFLPTELPESSGVSFAWAFEPCDELAGDMLNVVELGGDRFGVFVLDVTGHGVPAALMSVSVNRFLSAIGREGGGLAETDSRTSLMPSASKVARDLNARFTDDIRRQLVTMIYGILDVPNRRLSFVNAGHPGPLRIARSGETEIPVSENLPIGVADDWEYHENVLDFHAGDRVYLYSDGVIEVLNAKGEPFSLDRMSDVLVRRRRVTLQESVAEVVKSARRWCDEKPFDDDISILGIELH